MRIGTKSILFGYHQCLLHPLFVAWAWWRIYGFPFDPRLWLCFFVHDLGYLGKPNMDGPEGEQHPELGANIMSLFGWRWHDECLYHSRFYARKAGKSYSRLCVADKLAFCLYPNWLIKTLYWLSGEGYEYTKLAYGRGMVTTLDFDSTIKMWKEESYQWLKLHQQGLADQHTDSIIALDNEYDF